MQFTTGLVSLVVAASGALALPSSSSLEARQDSRVVHARFFADGGCNGAVIGEQDFVQGSQPSCIQIPVPGVRCTLVTSNNATQTLVLYDRNDCSRFGAGVIEIAPGTLPGPRALNAVAAQFE